MVMPIVVAKYAARLLLFVGVLAWAPMLAASPGSEPTPVLVELFTSEGCSDCPPADALLAELDRTQFVPGALAIVLSEHVTYWNQLGWRDPFSLDQMDARQQEYSVHFGLSSVYTPQMVVDGAEQFVGSDRNALMRAVQSSAVRQKLQVEIIDPRLENGKAIFSLRSPPGGRGIRWYAAIAADATRSEVARGENKGRTLHHTAVVRTLRQLKVEGAAQEFSLPVDAVATAGANPRLVVFAVEDRTGRVTAAAQSIVNR
jgi:hypothetical protein